MFRPIKSNHAQVVFFSFFQDSLQELCNVYAHSYLMLRLEERSEEEACLESPGDCFEDVKLVRTSPRGGGTKVNMGYIITY
jgi:hypothetical protein